MVTIIISELEFDDSKASVYHSIWGKIHVKFPHIRFPDEEWSDVVSSVLSMWAEAHWEFLQKQLQSYRLFFMDGPFCISVKKLPENKLLLAAETNNGEILSQDIVMLSDWHTALLDGIRLFLDTCESSVSLFSASSAYQQLAQAYQKLQKSTEDGSLS